MRRRVLKRASAFRDIKEISNYIATNSGRRLGELFLIEAEETFELLSRTPELGSRTFYQNPRLKGLRKWPVSRRFNRYIFFYFPMKDGIDVIHVIHASRNYQAILEAIKWL